MSVSGYRLIAKINEARCGLVFTSQEEYLECMVSLINEKDSRISLGKNAKKYLHENYDSESHADELFKVYDSI